MAKVYGWGLSVLGEYMAKVDLWFFVINLIFFLIYSVQTELTENQTEFGQTNTLW